jgi:hypothetical protein
MLDNFTSLVTPKAVFISSYVIWFFASGNLKSSAPDCLPGWPVWLFYWPMKTLLKLIGITQSAAFDQPLDPKRKYMVLCQPHGAYAFSGAIYIAPQTRLKLSPEYQNHVFVNGVASVLFYIPFVRELLLFLGCREVTKETLSSLIKDTTPYSLMMIPGGIYEQKSTRHDEEIHYVQKKLGFIRLACELGLDLLPMYGFGENQVFTVHSFGPSFRNLQHWIAQKLWVGLPIVTGRFGFTLIPHPVKITHVYGKPIKIKKNPNPSDELLDELYGKYCAEVQRMFKKHAPKLLPKEISDKGIRVIRIGVDEDPRMDK